MIDNMILFGKHTLIIMVLCLFGLVAQSQQSQIHHKNFIGLSLTELPFVDFRISYERRINPSHGIKLELSYKPVLNDYTDATNIDLGQSPTGWCYRNTANWYYISIGYRYYFDHRKTVYLSPEIFYKTMSADKIVYTYGTGGGGSDLTNVYEIRSMNSDIVGMNLLIGKKLRIRFSDGFNMGFDIFAGLTVRAKNIHTTLYGSTTVTYYHDSSPKQVTIPFTDAPIESDVNNLQMSMQFGIILFVSWK